ncbi:hypothetical protein FACS1894124_3340 [Spirochaetia bacterium]|nr:hypothetical protein FACS1894124_3340 [Spirochaetia bacterium]
MSLKSFLSKTDKKYRAAAVAGALGLSTLALLLCFSIAGSLFDLPFIARGLGNFFVRSYGVLAFLVPAYLVWAAFILADPVYRPQRIFVLAAAIAPFMTMALGLAFIRDFNYQAERLSVLKTAGKNGLGLFIILLTFVEGMVIRAFISLLFPGKKPARAAGKSGTLAPAGAADFVNFYANAASAGTTGLADDVPPAARTGVIIDFPEPKPLASVQAFREMEAMDENYRTIAADGEPEFPDPAGEAATPEPFDDSDAVGPFNSMDEFDEFDTFEDEPDYPGANGIEDTDGAEDFDVTGDTGEAETPDELDDFDDTEDPDETAAIDDADTFDDEDTPDDLDPPDDADEDEAPDLHPVFPRMGTGPVLSEILPADLFGAPPESAVSPGFPVKPAVNGGATAVPAASARSTAEKKIPRRNVVYQVPVEDILTQYPDGQYWIIDDATKKAAVTLKQCLEEFHIQAEVTGIRKGPVITMFEILPAPGVKLSRIVNLQDNIALKLAASSVRIVAPIPGKHAVGIEIPNKKRNIVSFREIIEGELQRELAHEGKRLEIPVVLGKDITGEAQMLDLTQTPHLLIAGSTGSGKSVCVNSMILSILYQRTPAECKLILIDPKIVELKLYNDIPHLLTPVITEPKKAFQALQYCIFEMERRYACLDSMGVRDIKSYNRRIKERGIATEHMPYIVVVIDEFADLMATTGKELESTVARLAAMSRAVGIHLVLATQRPSIDVITGLIKANIPSRIAFMVAGKMDSRIIIDQVGAEKLLGKGDMLYAGVVDPFPVRIQGAFVSDEEVERVVEHVKTLGEPDYIDDEIFFDDDDEPEPSLFVDGDDPLYEKALEIVVQQGKASASYIQRRLKIGYNRAARLVEEMEHHGVVGPAQGSKPRELLRAV